jgi:hypothetical protein
MKALTIGAFLPPSNNHYTVASLVDTMETLNIMAKPTCSCSSVRFFGFLPAIRNLIYKYLQPTGKTIKPIFTINSRHNGKSVASFIFPAKVFNVSKAFDKEAATVFYSENIFSFNSPYGCFDFMERIGKFKSASSSKWRGLFMVVNLLNPWPKSPHN